MESTEMTTEMEALKSKLRATWIAGDFGVIARSIEQGGRDFVQRLDLKPGTNVLDVACGTGNLALPAARAGADVTGIDIAPNLIEQATAGRVRILAVTSKRRSPVFPNVPTVAETYPGFEAVTWFGILAPAGTPAPIIEKLNTEINNALHDPEVRGNLSEAEFHKTKRGVGKKQPARNGDTQGGRVEPVAPANRPRD